MSQFASTYRGVESRLVEDAARLAIHENATEEAGRLARRCWQMIARMHSAQRPTLDELLGFAQMVESVLGGASQ